MTLTPIPAFSDNYIWCLLRNPESKLCLIVDPGEAAPVEKHLSSHNLKLAAILITHHHHDHTGGVAELFEKFNCSVYGPKNSSIENITINVSDGDQINIPELNLSFNILEIPGHTLDHIAYYNDEFLFCGDTLFAGGCGRVFEGMHQQMLDSLNKLKQLDPNLKVCCAHEYTEHNLAFAKMLDPDNTELIERCKQVQALQIKDECTLPSILAEELLTNPFLRCDDVEFQAAVKKYLINNKIKIDKPIDELIELLDFFKIVRNLKDRF